MHLNLILLIAVILAVAVFALPTPKRENSTEISPEKHEPLDLDLLTDLGKGHIRLISPTNLTNIKPTDPVTIEYYEDSDDEDDEVGPDGKAVHKKRLRKRCVVQAAFYTVAHIAARVVEWIVPVLTGVPWH